MTCGDAKSVNELLGLFLPILDVSRRITDWQQWHEFFDSIGKCSTMLSRYPSIAIRVIKQDMQHIRLECFPLDW